MSLLVLLQAEPGPVAIRNISGMVSNVGFPIAAFYLMYKMVNQSMRENTQALQELRAYIKENNGKH